MALGIVTVGGDRRPFVATIVDENGNIVQLLTPASSHALQGRSRDLPGVTINKVADVVDGPAGVVTFNSIGALVTQAQLTAAGLHRATFRLKVRYFDVASKLDFTDSVELVWDEDPLQPA